MPVSGLFSIVKVINPFLRFQQTLRFDCDPVYKLTRTQDALKVFVEESARVCDLNPKSVGIVALLVPSP